MHPAILGRWIALTARFLTRDRLRWCRIRRSLFASGDVQAGLNDLDHIVQCVPLFTPQLWPFAEPLRNTHIFGISSTRIQVDKVSVQVVLLWPDFPYLQALISLYLISTVQSLLSVYHVCNREQPRTGCTCCDWRISSYARFLQCWPYLRLGIRHVEWWIFFCATRSCLLEYLSDWFRSLCWWAIWLRSEPACKLAHSLHMEHLASPVYTANLATDWFRHQI